MTLISKKPLKTFTEKLTIWNNDTFQNIYKSKKRTLARIAKIQRYLCSHNHPQLLALKKELQDGYNKLLRYEEEM